MAATEAAPLTSERLTWRAVADALQLSTSVGWNQTADDWALFMAHGTVKGVFAEGMLIATAAALPYGALGYVAMVIVAPGHRSRGIARHLLGEAIAELESRGCMAVLDATPAGEAVYSRAGFSTISRLRRWEGLAVPQTELALPDLRRATIDEAPRLAALDEVAFGASRRILIEDFLRRPGTQAMMTDDAFVIRRRGVRADQIGPLVASDAQTAAYLLAAALALRPGPVFLDLFDRWNDLARDLEGRGFAAQRPFSRMVLGATAIGGHPGRLFVSAGPEFG